MARIINPLTDKKCLNAKPKDKDYKMFDGGGLFLLVKTTNVKSWRMKYKTPEGKESTIVFGDYPTISLKDAREQREQTKQLLVKGINPAIERQKRKYKDNEKDSFQNIAFEWIEQTANNKRWSYLHKDKVTKALELHVLPVIGHKSVSNITTRELITLIQSVINKGLLDVPKRLKQHIIAIFRHALYKGLIDINPALDLAGITIENKTQHRASVSLENLQELIKSIDNYDCYAVTKLALKISLNVFVRSSELRFARWEEIDLTNKLWTIPPVREKIGNVINSERGAKMKTAHLVPLSNQVCLLFNELKKLTLNSGLVFTNDNKTPIYLLSQALRNFTMNEHMTYHGFRTLACSALIESGLFSKDAIERQMSHQERNNVRAAYIHKAEHLKERIAMMQWWSDYIDHVTDNGYIAPYDFKGSIA